MRILVIDDDVSVTAAIQAIFTRHQYETVVTSRAHGGIHAFRATGFDVVMIDLFMPGMNGLDTIARIRSESAVPIIAMSGFRLRNSLDPDQASSAWRSCAVQQSRCASRSRLRNWFQPSTAASARRHRTQEQCNDTEGKTS
jgi:CheY-like chemotaxis protein